MNLDKLSKEFDIRKYLDDLGIFYMEEGKNIANDSIGICCPSCGDDGFHLGIHEDSKLYNCWKCVEKGNLVSLIILLEGVTSVEAIKRIKKNEKEIDRFKLQNKLDLILSEKNSQRRGDWEFNEKNEPKKVILPETKKLSKLNSSFAFEDHFLNFIFDRNYTIDQLMKWHVKACKFGRYRNRLIFPIYSEGRLVNFLGRTVVGGDPKYDNLKNSEAIIPIRQLLYGSDFVSRGQKQLIVCEGVFDVIRVGRGKAVALFGKTVTPEQIEIINSFNIKEIIWIALDSDALFDAEKLKKELSPFVDCEIKIFKFAKGEDPDNCTSKEFNKVKGEYSNE